MLNILNYKRTYWSGEIYLMIEQVNFYDIPYAITPTNSLLLNILCEFRNN